MPDFIQIAHALAPQTVLLLGLLTSLVGALFGSGRQRWIDGWGWLTVVAYCLAVYYSRNAPLTLFGWHKPLYYDYWAGLMAFGFSLAWWLDNLQPIKRDTAATTPKGLYLASWLAIWLGAEITLAANHYLMVYLGIISMSLSTYFLVTSYAQSGKYASEAGLKYFTLGGLSMGVMLYGLSFFYGLTGSLDIQYESWMTLPKLKQQLLDESLPFYAILMVALGLSFKLGTWPMHNWVMDVYRTTHTPVLILLLIIPKIAVLVAAQSLYPAWAVLTPFARHLIAGMIIISMTYANLMALTRKSWLELLSWSSVSHNSMAWVVVLMLPSVSTQIWMLWFGFYAVATAGLLAWVGRLPSEAQKDFSLLGPWLRRYPMKGLAMVAMLLSLAGLPPLAGFFPKLLLLSSLDSLVAMVGYEPGVYLFLALLANIVLGFAYYLKPIYLGYIKQNQFATQLEPETQIPQGMSSLGIWVYIYTCAAIAAFGGLCIGLLQ